MIQRADVELCVLGSARRRPPRAAGAALRLRSVRHVPLAPEAEGRVISILADLLLADLRGDDGDADRLSA